MSDETDDIAVLMRGAFDRAFQAQIEQLYKVYLANTPAVTSQQAYTEAGIEKAIETYRLAIAAVDTWEQAQKD
jgi:hypothetical protein